MLVIFFDVVDMPSSRGLCHPNDLQELSLVLGKLQLPWVIVVDDCDARTAIPNAQLLRTDRIAEDTSV